MRYVVAVSGGVDSVALLDVMASKYAPEQLIVAHFDHGIRVESADDALFVKGLAEQYGARFETKREVLGEHASEDLARTRRYAFLRAAAKAHDAVIVTAHHGDDIAETIAINLTRGTGWRGLAVLDSDIMRPLLSLRKSDIQNYAVRHNLAWREDATNDDDKYLRNALRKKLAGIDEDIVKRLSTYRRQQVALKQQIDQEASRLIGTSPYSRYFFTMIADHIAVELLRAVFVAQTGESPTIPQRQHALHAIKTFAAGKRCEITKGTTLYFSKTTFVVEVTPEVLS